MNLPNGSIDSEIGTLISKLDRLKSSDGECGSNARQAIRLLENLRLSGNLTEGVPLSNGGFLRLEVNHVDVPLPEGMQPNSQDNRILKVCRGLCDQGESVI
ncbi:PIN domain-containing protein [Lacrimispora sp.]|uniref:PIN domain-containing protein n=1 Tax=Lacrimispora sp. TaxID=2719234 RepID=UPI002856DA4D|nr:PIN domain-containing protein [Lacrimispora sp.]MDR7811458.1 PIN domain-containing protein [Lacrimispora sp.]